MSEVAKVDVVSLQIDVQGESTQPEQDDPNRHTPDDAIEPPANLEQLAALTASASNRRPIIEALALNTVGLGYSIAAAPGGEENLGDDPEAEAALIKARVEACWKRDRALTRPSARVGFSAVRFDEEEVGNGYIEVSRNKTTGEIDGLFHLPGARVRRLIDRSGYVLLRPGWRGGLAGDKGSTRFVNFGEKVEYNDDGTPKAKLAKNGMRWAINEVIHFRIYSSESRDYGLPRDVALATDYAGDRLAGESNVSFFQSSGTPPTIIFVQGEEQKDGSKISFRVPRETSERISTTLKSDGGTIHRVAVIPVPPGTKTEAIKLGEVSDRDIGFTKYRQDNLKRQLAHSRLQPIFISVSEQDGTSVEIQRSITLEQLFDPEQGRWEDVLNDSIIREFGKGRFQLKFKRLAVENDAVRRDSADKMAEGGNITRREHRAAHGYEPIPEAAKSSTEIEWGGGTYKSAEPEPGQVPFGWNDELYTTGTPAGAQNRQTEGLDARGKPLIDKTQSNRPDQLPDDTPVVKGTKVEHVEVETDKLSGEVMSITREAVDQALQRTMPLAAALAASQPQPGSK